MAKTFNTRYRVMYNDSDPYGCLQVGALGNYILDTAGLHATELDISMQQLAAKGMTWVMSGMHVEIHKMPMINSYVDIETRISDCSRICSKRDFIVTCDGEAVAEVSSDWLIMNTSSRRPVFLLEVFPQIAEMVDPENSVKRYQHLRFAMDDAEYRSSRRIEYSDIDINNHLYSIRYIEMSLDAVGKELLHQRKVKSLDVNFAQEVRYGQEVDVLMREDNGAYLVEMREGGSTMYRARIVLE